MTGAEFPVRAVLDDKDIDKLIAALLKAGKSANMSEKEIKEMNEELRRTGRDGVGNVNKLNQQFDNLYKGGITRIRNGIIAAFAIDKLLDFGKEIVSITSEFQKFEAVLTNTLGSRSAAMIGFSMIRKFAAETPYSVQELIASFVKLNNQGFNPTIEQMTKLGDVAASQGKSFDQLTEAIIDAQTGEFERLKEFGIRASKQGDQVVFTFKGVKTQVDFTTDSIRQYILGLGEAEGVSGSMAAISATLGGAISNLGDSWDTFMETLGDGESGPLKDAVRRLSILLSLANEFVKTEEQRQEDLNNSSAAQAVENFKALVDVYGDVNKAKADYIRLLDFELSMQQARNDELVLAAYKGDEQAEAEQKAVFSRIEVLKAEIQAINDYVDALDKAAKPGEEVKSLGLIEALEVKLKDLKQAKEKAFTKEDIFLLNNEIERTERQLKRLIGLGQEDLPFKLDQDKLKEYADGLDENIAKASENAVERAEKSLERLSEKYEKEQERMRRAEEKRRQAHQEAVDYARDTEIAAMQSVFDFRVASVDIELERTEAARARELELAGNNEEAKKKINEKFDKQRARLQQKQAQREQDAALFSILVNQGPAIVKTVANLGFPAAFPFIAAVATLVGLQLNATRGAALPKFAKGKYRIEGPGSETSDSILSLLSKNESVVTAERSKGKFGNVVQALVEGNDTDVIRAMSMHLRGDLFNPPAASDSVDLLQKLDEVKSSIDNKKETHISIDEDGFKKFSVKAGYWTHYFNQRYQS